MFFIISSVSPPDCSSRKTALIFIICLKSFSLNKTSQSCWFVVNLESEFLVYANFFKPRKMNRH